MEQIEHKMISVNGINMHIAEKGQGPLVLFIHGFPELWYTWRHQILYLASHGYKAVAPDLRGYGDTNGAPISDITKFTTLHIVADLIELLNAIVPEQEKVFVVGHDWGAFIAWHLCLYRPDRVKALVNLSVPFHPRNPDINIVDGLRVLFGDDHYICRFQEPGDMEAVFKKLGTKTVIKQLFLKFREPAALYLPKGKEFEDSTDAASTLSSWLSEEDIDYFATKFEQTGFTGGLNYYRAFNLSWELNAPWTKARVMVPTKFIVGDQDLVYLMPGTKEYIHNGGFKKDVPLLEEVVIMEGVAHFINQEKADEINKLIYDFIRKF